MTLTTDLLTPSQLDTQYNARARVPEFAQHVARWQGDSAQVRAAVRGRLGLRYGPAPGETLDVFPSDRPRAPVLVFIHGGYWRSMDKSDHSFLAPVFNQAGATVVIPNYDLCPAVTIPEISLQMVRALAWTLRGARRDASGSRQR